MYTDTGKLSVVSKSFICIPQKTFEKWSSENGKLGCRCAKHNLEPFSLLHISKYISVMYIKLAEATEELHFSLQFKFQTIISFSMSNRGSQNWDPGTQNTNFALSSHFNCSISQKLFEVCI